MVTLFQDPSPPSCRVELAGKEFRNLVYIIADKETRECMVIDGAWDVEAISKVNLYDPHTLTFHTTFIAQ